uniref:Uncharacterized protein n=1 Tax=Anguilla anguilla TaxID=7936 RepID=A0A0E9RN54_ANGAN
MINTDDCLANSMTIVFTFYIRKIISMYNRH